MIENVTNIILFNNRFLAPTPISLNGLVTALTMFKPICAILEYFFASLTITLLSIFFLVVSNVVICFTVNLFTNDNPFLFNKSSILWITYFANKIYSSIDNSCNGFLESGKHFEAIPLTKVNTDSL